MSVTVLYIRNLLQLVLNPRHAWEEIARRPLNPPVLMRAGFYPLLALTAASVFIGKIYTPGTFDLADSLEEALVVFLSLFTAYFATRATFEWALPRITDDERGDLNNASVMAIYCLSLFALICIIDNLCPVRLAVMKFLPLLIIIVAWPAREFLNIRRYATSQYILICVATLVALPILISAILNLLL